MERMKIRESLLPQVFRPPRRFNHPALARKTIKVRLVRINDAGHVLEGPAWTGSLRKGAMESRWRESLRHEGPSRQNTERLRSSPRTIAERNRVTGRGVYTVDGKNLSGTTNTRDSVHQKQLATALVSFSDQVEKGNSDAEHGNKRPYQRAGLGRTVMSPMAFGCH
jgi:hypothetical protein